MATWKEIESDSAYNTALAAGVSENYQSTTRRAQNFNSLIVTNRGAVDCKIALNGQNLAGRVFEVPAGGILGISPEDGIWFSFVKQTNLHAANAEVANTILVRWAHSVKIGA